MGRFTKRNKFKVFFNFQMISLFLNDLLFFLKYIVIDNLADEATFHLWDENLNTLIKRINSNLVYLLWNYFIVTKMNLNDNK